MAIGSDKIVVVDALQRLLDMQDQLETATLGFGLKELAKASLRGDESATSERIHQFKELAFEALIREASEAMDEMGSKPWATSKHWNEEPVKGEVIDMLFFLLCGILLSGMEAREVFDRYYAKWAINMDRQEHGYDGVSTKCPKCKRALDDPTTLCTPDLCIDDWDRKGAH